MPETENEFEKAAQEGAADQGAIKEFISFLKSNKKWWLAPIIIIFLLFGLLIILSGTGAAPFIYTLF